MRCAGVVQRGHGAVGWVACTRRVVWAVVASTAHASRCSVAASGNKRVKMVVAGVEMKAVSSFQRCCLWGNEEYVSPQHQVGHVMSIKDIRYNNAGCQDIPECHITKLEHERM